MTWLGAFLNVKDGGMCCNPHFGSMFQLGTQVTGALSLQVGFCKSEKMGVCTCVLPAPAAGGCVCSWHRITSG